MLIFIFPAITSRKSRLDTVYNVYYSPPMVPPMQSDREHQEKLIENKLHH